MSEIWFMYIRPKRVMGDETSIVVDILSTRTSSIKRVSDFNEIIRRATWKFEYRTERWATSNNWIERKSMKNIFTLVHVGKKQSIDLISITSSQN